MTLQESQGELLPPTSQQKSIVTQNLRYRRAKQDWKPAQNLQHRHQEGRSQSQQQLANHANEVSSRLSQDAEQS